MRLGINRRKQALTAALLIGMGTSLSGCAAWEYVFGYPTTEDMPEIGMKHPVGASEMPDLTPQTPGAQTSGAQAAGTQAAPATTSLPSKPGQRQSEPWSYGEHLY